jgi:TPR repeat protein
MLLFLLSVLSASSKSPYFDEAQKLWKGKGGVKQNQTKAAELYRLAALAKDARAYHRYAQLLSSGTFLPQNREEAVVFYYLHYSGRNKTKAMKYYQEVNQFGPSALFQVSQFSVNETESANFSKEAADKGFAAAQVDWGNRLRSGTRGPKKNVKEAVKYYRLAAEAGNLDAAVALSQIFLNGEGGIHPDLTTGLHNLELAAKGNSTYAQLFLADLYWFGQGNIERDRNVALSYYAKVSERLESLGYPHYAQAVRKGPGGSGFGDAVVRVRDVVGGFPEENQREYALKLWNGSGVIKDRKRTASLLKKLANQSETAAQFEYAEILFFGLSGERGKKSQALKLYTKAAERGYVLAQARLLSHGKLNNTVQQKYNRTVHAKNSSEKLFRYGQAILNGKTYVSSKAEGFEFYRLAACGGHRVAAYEYALSLWVGSVGPVNLERAVEFLQKSAQAGYDKAQFRLAGLYLQGTVVKRDTEAALKYYKRAADGPFKHVTAAFKCAELLWEGEELDQEVKEAVRYFCQAANSSETRRDDQDRPSLSSAQRKLARDRCIGTQVDPPPPRDDDDVPDDGGWGDSDKESNNAAEESSDTETKGG